MSEQEALDAVPADSGNGVERHFPNTFRLLQERSGKSESPARRDRVNDEAAVARPLSPAVCPVHQDEACACMADEFGGSESLESRLERAAARRERLLTERRQAQLAAAQVRAAKLQQVKVMRREAVEIFIQKAPALLAQLRDKGLRGGQELPSADLIEHILISDQRVCSKCEKPARGPLPQICQVTKKPHRRSLVVVAESLLKLIGDTKVNLVPPKIGATAEALDALPVSATVSDGPSRQPVTKRGISVLPHLFVLAYLHATGSSLEGDGVEDRLLQENARHLIEIVDQLHHIITHIAEEAGENKEGYIGELLASFAKTWRQYAKLADGGAQQLPPNAAGQPTNKDNRQRVTEELVQSATDAFVATRLKLAVETNRNEATALTAFAQLLITRIQEIGGPSAVEQAVSKAEAKTLELQAQRSRTNASTPSTLSEALRPASAPLTPEHRPRVGGVAIPPAPLASYATGSDTDRATSHSEAELSGAAPELSNAPTPIPEQSAAVSRERVETSREKRERLELRARTAFQVKMGVADPPSDRDVLAQQLADALRDTAMQKIEEELNQHPPALSRLPSALGAVADALVEALPKRLRGKVGREIQDVLDWSNVRRQVAHSEQHIAELMNYVVARVRELGAPAREAILQEKCDALQVRLSQREDPLGTIVADMLRFMLDAIKQLRQDISSFTLAMISNELSQQAEMYHDEFMRECMPPPSEWARTIDFFQYYSGDDNRSEVSRLLEPPLADSIRLGATALTETELRLRAVLFVGAVDLLRSANKPDEQRWAHFAAEALLVEKNFIFQCANDVQKCTLRLFVSGTVSMLLHAKRPKATPLANLLKDLDKRLCEEWLQKVDSLSTLQRAIRDAVNDFLCVDGNCDGPASTMSDAEVGVLDGMLAKLTDVTAPQYAAFESRVIRAVESALLMDTRTAQSIPVAQRPKTIGVVSEATFTLGFTLRRVLDYHWCVMRSRYASIQRELLKQL